MAVMTATTLAVKSNTLFKMNRNIPIESIHAKVNTFATNMQKISYANTECSPTPALGLSRFDLSYLIHPETFSKLVDASDYYAQIDRAIQKRGQFPHRNILVQKLHEMYGPLDKSEQVINNLKLLQNEQCFTVCCAHQPCILGGPLYWVFKIASTIALSHYLNERYPEHSFVPVYYIGFEDHDFEEINHIKLFNKKYTWVQNSGPAVGRLSTQNLEIFLNEIKSLFTQNAIANEYFDTQLQFAHSAQSYADYFIQFVNHLFGKTGLILLHPDNSSFKDCFRDLMQQELQHSIIQSTSQESCNALKELDFDLQAHPREINLFYHALDGRKRIITTAPGEYALADFSKSWKLDEIIQELEKKPENFSPNVLLRPLLQETILPNVAFVGGGAELHYWMQLKSCFDKLKIPFPALIRRTSAFWIDHKLVTKIAKTGYDALMFLKSEQEIQDHYINQFATESPVSPNSFLHLKNSTDEINRSLTPLDASTQTSIRAELQKIHKSIEHIENKIQKYLKSKHDQDIQKLLTIRGHLFPEKQLQERVSNFLPFYFSNPSEFIENLIKIMNPLNRLFFMIQETVDKDSITEE